jgi:hypothetical protein
MPNWVYNEIIFTGAPEKVEALKKQVGATIQVPGQELAVDGEGNYLRDGDGGYIHVDTVFSNENPVFSFWNIVRPTTPEELGTYKNQGWYDWNINNWGTKWDVAGKDVDVRDDSPGHWHIYFDTAWSPPHEALVALSEQHPDVEIRNEWREEQGFGAHQVYSEGTHWVDKEWNIPESHEEYEEHVGDCYCESEPDEASYPFADCPRQLSETQLAIAELEKVSDLV